MKKTFLASLLSLSIFFCIGTVLVFADPPGSNTNPPPTGSNRNPSIRANLQNPFNCGGVQPCTLFTLLRTVINNILLPIGGVLAVLSFIFSGFLYVTAQGDTKKIGTAHNALLYTAIGTAVLLGSWVIANVIERTINQLR